MGRRIAEWQAARDELAAAELAEHPDITDHHGRVWVWVDGDLYRHCGMAWTSAQIRNTEHLLPSASLFSNRNYSFCSICKGDKP
jgi:hypothetical protein